MSDDTVQCSTHGEAAQAFVCSHLAFGDFALGFHSAQADEEDPSPSAWCDDCEIIRKSHGGWNDESEKLLVIRLVCLRCFEEIRIRNTRPSVTLDDLADLQWKCGTCDEVHTGPALDIGFDQPYYWTAELAAEAHPSLLERMTKKKSPTFLTPDYCSIRDESFFVRGVLRLPIIGTKRTLFGEFGAH